MNKLVTQQNNNFMNSEAMEAAKMIANSDLAPKDFKGKPGNVLVAIQMGMELGLAPMQALQNITVINGKACIWGDAMLAVVQSSGKLEYINEWEENGIAYCETKRKGYPKPHTTTYSDNDAKSAGLLNKPGPWQTHKNRMKQVRARAFNLRDQFADVLRGISSAEEVQDYAVDTTTSKSPIPLPKRKVQTSTEEPLRVEAASVNANESEKISEDQQKKIFSLVNYYKVPNNKVKEYLEEEYGYSNSKEIEKSNYEKICDWIAGNVKESKPDQYADSYEEVEE